MQKESNKLPYIILLFQKLNTINSHFIKDMLKM